MMATNKQEVKKTAKPKKERRSAGQFFKEVFGEVKKLSWPSKKELVSYTLTVLGFIALFAVIIFALDMAFGEGLGLLPGINIKNAVESASEAAGAAEENVEGLLGSFISLM